MAFPLLMLVLSVVEIVIWGALFGRFDQFWMLFVVNGVFGNITHVALTFFMLMKMPEFQDWRREQTGGNPARFWRHALMALTLIAAAFVLRALLPDGNAVKLSLTFLLLVLPLHHVLFQIRGISVCYSAEAHRRNPARRGDGRRPSLERREKYGFYIFFAGILMVAFAAFSEQATRVPAFFHGRHWFWLTAAVLIGGAGLIFRSAYGLLRPGEGNKCLYLLRIFTMPLHSVSLIAGSATSMYHGMEYFYIFGRITGRSRAAGSGRRLLFWGTVCVLLYTGFYAALIYVSLKARELPWEMDTLLNLNIVVVVLSFWHYYLDRQIFRMRDPVTRRHIGALL